LGLNYFFFWSNDAFGEQQAQAFRKQSKKSTILRDKKILMEILIFDFFVFWVKGCVWGETEAGV